MSFTDAVKSCLSQYVGFAGRARRSEFWYFYLFTIVVGLVALTIDRVILNSGNIGVVGSLVSLLLLLPELAVGARRLHDTGRSGWWMLIGLIPLVGLIVLIVFFCQDSQPGPNRFGASPKYPAPTGY